MEFCNQCPNRCSRDNLKCKRGEAYFNGENVEKFSKNKHHGLIDCNSENELAKLLIICGKVASHKSEKMLEHNIDESAMFDALTDEEQATLKAILEKLNTKWKSEHEKHHKKHHKKH